MLQIEDRTGFVGEKCTVFDRVLVVDVPSEEDVVPKADWAAYVMGCGCVYILKAHFDVGGLGDGGARAVGPAPSAATCSAAFLVGDGNAAMVTWLGSALLGVKRIISNASGVFAPASPFRSRTAVGAVSLPGDAVR